MAVIGIDLGGTKVAAAIFHADGKMLVKDYKLLSGATGNAVADKVVEVVKSLIEQRPEVHIDAVGICIPGIVYSKKGTVWAPNIPGWENFPLKEYLKEKIGIQGLKVCVESDRTCYILGEAWKGAAKGCENAIYLAVGTGIGAGILLDGHIVHGANDIVGATGWMALQGPYTHEWDQCGCFETFASGSGIGYQAQKLYRDPSKTSYDVFANYGKDPIATEVLDKAIQMWGMGTANLVSLFNPEKVIFGGGIFGPASQFIPRIYKEACKWGQPISMKDVKFCASQIEGDAALLGATALAIREINPLD
ncbi:MAG: ROK family protein [Bacteroidales bacterium]|nr:ROK family protein [Candidatus Cacconaster merdequi]